MPTNHNSSVVAKNSIMIRLILAGFIILALAACGNDSPEVERERVLHVVGELRGNTLIFIRELGAGEPPDQFALHEEGTVWRGTYAWPVPPGHSKLPQEVDLAIWEAANAVRLAWCEQEPTFSEPAPDEVWYIVGIQCNVFNTWQVEVPTSELPPGLVGLVEALPPPESR